MSRIAKLFSVPELRNRVLTVLGLLVAYRALAAIPIPEVDSSRLAEFFSSNSILGFLNFFSGGGLESLSLVMLGVSPYITATIIMQLLTIIFPRLKELYYEDGERGKAKFNRISRYATVPLAFISGYGFLSLLASQSIIPPLSLTDMLGSVAIITAGSMAALWIGELITEQKIGNGVSLIIFSGIIAGLPSQLGLAYQSLTPDVMVGYAVVALLIVLGIVYVTEGERRIPIAYARQVRGNKVYGGSASYLPVKVNSAGMIPLIFAISVLTFPQFIAQAIGLVSPQWGSQLAEWVNAFLANTWAYSAFYFVLVFGFTYFYTSITFNPSEISKNLQRSGGFIPGIRPGEQTESTFQRVLSRITFFGALTLGIVAIIPTAIQGLIALVTGTGMAASSSLALSGTAILIVVAVALESMRQIDSQLSLRDYDRN
jgi:preprotein translocase subunit SecY